MVVAGPARRVELYDPAADQWVLLGPLRAKESLTWTKYGLKK
jgi:hypothetical protein